MDEQGWRWISAGLTGLKAKRDPLRSILLDKNRLRLIFDEHHLDEIDLYSASLVSAAIERGRSTLFVLPDNEARRPAFLFGYALLNVWWKSRDVSHQVRPRILYCGANAEVRAQLSKVKVAGLRQPLDSVFDQVDLPRGTRTVSRDAAGLDSDSQLPLVVTSYAPADPGALIAELRPRCVAVDFADAPSLPWVSELLQSARRANTLVLCWGNNPMSEVVSSFEGVGHHIVHWPFGRGVGGNAKFDIGDPPDVLLQPFTVTQIHPVLVNPRADTTYSDALVRAGATLRGIRRQGAVSSYAETALQHHWRLYRDIETLCVPLSLHDAEAPGFWGMSPIARTLEICRRFQELLQGRATGLSQVLAKATDELCEAIDWLRDNDPPLWTALSAVVKTPARDGYARLITFHSRSKKTLFLFALLAKLNLTEGDIRPLNNWIVSLEELRLSESRGQGLRSWAESDSVPAALTPVPTIVALPSARLSARLWPVFTADDLMLVVHDFQSRVIAGRVKSWSDGLSTDLGRLCAAIADLSPILPLSTIPRLSSRVELTNPAQLDGSPVESPRASSIDVQPLWTGPELQDEMAWLFEDDQEIGGIDNVADEGGSAPDEGEPWADDALEVTFVGGWNGLFERAAKVNFIDRGSARCEERHVSSLRLGDHVLILPFQRRQSLYDLVLGRVHGHPAIQLHLAVLNRWHGDLVRGVQEWSRRTDARRHGLGVAEKLLAEIRGKGCKLSSPLAVQFWIARTTLCPSDPEDIRRVAEVLDLDFVRTNYRRIGQAAARIRGLHRGLANRLNHWLADRARGLAESHDSEIIDEETRLTFGDIRTSFVIAEVLSVRAVPGPFLRSTLGSISKGGGHGPSSGA